MNGASRELEVARETLPNDARVFQLTVLNSEASGGLAREHAKSRALR